MQSQVNNIERTADTVFQYALGVYTSGQPVPSRISLIRKARELTGMSFFEARDCVDLVELGYSKELGGMKYEFKRY